MFAVPSLDKFAENKEDNRIPGEIIYGDGSLVLNPGKNAVILKVVSNGDRPIQVFALNYLEDFFHCVVPTTSAF